MDPVAVVSSPRRARTGVPTVEILAAGAGLLTLTALFGFFRPGVSDFQMFYASGSAWLHGHPLYTAAVPNLNPPLAVFALFAPLAHLPYRAAQGVWLALEIVALVASLRVIAAELQLPRRQTILIAACLGLTYPAWLIWYQGQMMWVLLYPATLSWRAFRRGDQFQAGAWFAPVVALKPPLALVALFLPWRVWLTTGALSLFLTLCSVLWTGHDVWIDWLRFGNQVTWLSWPDNVSIWGVITRWRSGSIWGGRLADVPIVLAGGIVLLALGAAWRLSRETDRDRRMALAVMAGVLFSPLGWIYYLPIGLGALIASWPQSRPAWIAFAALCVPWPIVYPLTSISGAAPLIGSLYTVALLCGLMTMTAQDVPASHVRVRVFPSGGDITAPPSSTSRAAP